MGQRQNTRRLVLMTWPKTKINARLPRRVTGIEYNDPILVLFGDGWFLKLSCPWSGFIAGAPIDWDSSAVEDRAWDLIGTQLLSAEEADRPIDVRFSFEHAVLTARPDDDEDAWVLAFPDMVAVGGVD